MKLAGKFTVDRPLEEVEKTLLEPGTYKLTSQAQRRWDVLMKNPITVKSYGK